MGEDKLWADIGGRPLMALTLAVAAAAGAFDAVVIATREATWARVRGLAISAGLPEPAMVVGGATRQQSVALALDRCAGHDLVCVHDMARPLAAPDLFRAVLQAAQVDGAATAGVPCVDTVKQIDGDRIIATLDRRSLIATQTPQAFAAGLLRQAHQEARELGIVSDDDSALVERLGVTVTVVRGDPANFKVTLPQDLVLLRALMGGHG